MLEARAPHHGDKDPVAHSPATEVAPAFSVKMDLPSLPSSDQSRTLPRKTCFP